jgi:hypothetical protein
MAKQNNGIGSPATHLGKRRKCTLHISNRSGSLLNLVIHSTNINTVRAMTIRRRKKLHLIKGTYVVEIWLTSGRITIIPVDIPHISIERITTRKDVSIRGRKIVADFINDRARLEIDRERSAGEQV